MLISTTESKITAVNAIIILLMLLNNLMIFLYLPRMHRCTRRHSLYTFPETRSRVDCMVVAQQESSEEQTPSPSDGMNPRRLAIRGILVTTIQAILMLVVGFWLAYGWSWFSIVTCIVILLASSALLRITGAYTYIRTRSIRTFDADHLLTLRQILIALSFILLAYAAGRVGPPQGWNGSGTGLGWLSIAAGIIGALSNIPSLFVAVNNAAGNQSARI